MKKLLVCAFIAVFSMAFAQKGTVLVYGDLGIGSTKNQGTYYKTSTFSINPGIGYQFHDNWTAGAEFGLGFNTNEDSNGDKYKTNTFSVGPFVRYSKGISETFAFWTQLGVGYKHQKDKIEPVSGSDTKTDYNGLYAKLTPALFINFKNSFGLNFSIGGVEYNTLKQDTSGSSTASSLSITFGKQVNVGISKNF